MFLSALGTVKGMNSLSESHSAGAYAFIQCDQFSRPKVFQSSLVAEESLETSSSTNSLLSSDSVRMASVKFICDENDRPERDAFLVDTADAMNFATEVMLSKKRSSGCLELTETYLESENFVDEIFEVTSSSSYKPHSLISSCDGGNC
jgi:hypothetical protein